MNQFQKIFDAQKALFATGVTRSYEWRVDQLDRMARMIRENEARFQQAMAKEFKTASQEYIFDSSIRWRERGPEEPAERVDEAGRSTGAKVPGQNRPQGDDLSRALRRGAYHRTVQRTFAPADPPGARGARGGKHLYSHAE